MPPRFLQPARQGDVLLVPVATLAAGSPVPRDPDGSTTLAHGEVTGHRHRFADGERTTLRRDEGDRLLLDIGPGGATLRHEEHGPATIEPAATFAARQGLPPATAYEVRIERDYDPALHGSHQVED